MTFAGIRNGAAEVMTRMRELFQKKADAILQELDLNDAVRNAIHILAHEAQKRGIDLSANAASETLPVRANRLQVEQVILNLVLNGMDAMRDCGPDRRGIVIRTTHIGTSEGMISVLDSGTGIPDDKLKDIFQPFITTKDQG